MQRSVPIHRVEELERAQGTLRRHVVLRMYVEGMSIADEQQERRSELGKLRIAREKGLGEGSV